MTARAAARRLCWLCCAGLGLLLPALGEAGSSSATSASTPSLSTSVDLGFSIGVDAYIFFSVGGAAFPTLSGTVPTATFTVQPSAPGGVPAIGNNLSTSWTGLAPPLTVTASNNVLPVEVRSNAGAVSLRASVDGALSNGSGNTIAMSRISATSSDLNFPAPLLPDAGTGASVNVQSTAFAGAVTSRTANWTFNYANAASPVAGNYAGRVTFIATTP